MSKLEQIIRPSAVGDIRPLNFTPARKQPKTPGDNLKVWGNAGDDIFALSAHLKQDVKPAEWEESKRTYDVVKIMNPADNDQSVEVEAMTEYQSRNQIDKSRTTLRFSKVQPAANVEIVSRGNVRKSGS